MSKPRILKVFAGSESHEDIASLSEVVEQYDAFTLVEASEANTKKITKKYPVEDITGQFVIIAGEDKIDTTKPRFTSSGKRATHPAYKAVQGIDKSPHHHLVQFVGPIKKKWLSKVKSLGGELRRPFSNFTYIVRSDEATLAKIVELPFVRWAGHLSHRNRVFGDTDPSEKALPRTKYLPSTHSVAFFDKRDLKLGLKQLKKIDHVKVVSVTESGALVTIQVDGTKSQQRNAIASLSAIHGVETVRNKSLKRTSNDVAAGIMSAPPSLLDSLGLDGSGEVIAVCDTGLDSGDDGMIHPDFSGRITSIKSYPIGPSLDPFIHNPGDDDGASDLDSGHGTHVAGSVLGSGISSEHLNGQAAPIRGLAHGAGLVFQAVEQECDWKNLQDELEYGRYLLVGIPDDLTPLFQFAYDQGARIHSNSWGGGDAGAYDEQCEQLDAFVWRRKDFCVVVAAGNDGTDFDGDGKINPTSVTSPATAKNCLTVGPSESMRTHFNGNKYGEWWPDDYPVKPFKDAPMANSAGQVAAFSSRGPTLDGRTKPDVVAPGTFILSTRSRFIAPNNTAWAAFPPSHFYFHMGGTSMATPLVAGAVAILRQFLRRDVGYASPSAALLKAATILSASKLAGVSPASQRSDNDQGFGLVDVGSVVAPSGSTNVLFVDQPSVLETGEQEEILLRVGSSDVPLEVVLVYSDFPGSSLVNNLNLFLQAPNGSLLVGNQSGSNLIPDSQNNVEFIHVKRPATGDWKIRVVGSNVPQGPQDFALAIRGIVE